MLFVIVSFVIHPIRFVKDWWRWRQEEQSYGD